MANADQGTGFGWGLPFPWDAFGDGTENPAATVYGITTALAVRSLLDVHSITSDDKYAEAARKALEYYASFFSTTEDGGYFWYSDQSSDDREVHNVSSMLMGQYARAAQVWSRQDFRRLADLASSHLRKASSTSALGVHWPYGADLDRPNDSVHAAYTVQGLVDYLRYADERLNLARALNYLEGFVHGGVVAEFHPGAGLSSDVLERPARVWGVGMLIYTLADAGRCGTARAAAESLGQYEFAPNRFATTPDESSFVPRSQAHVAFGLARLEAEPCGGD